MRVRSAMSCSIIPISREFTSPDRRKCFRRCGAPSARTSRNTRRIRGSADAAISADEQTDDSVGYFIRPTLIQAKRPDYRTMCEELFGPVLTLYVYPEKQWNEILSTVDQTSPYGLTGAVFATDRTAIADAHRGLSFAAGIFYVNDKPTGAVVGQQPFGGSRASGTNDNASSIINLLRW